MLRSGALAALAVTLLAACGPKMIPGTEIEDTSENRQLIDVMGAYRDALQARDAKAIADLTSPTFYEDSGTPDGEDDYDQAGLKDKLERWLKQTKSVRAEITVKRIEVEGDTAKVNYFYDLAYQFVPAPGADATWKRESDPKQMTFRKEDGRWRIVKGV